MNYNPRPPEEIPFLERAQTQSRDGLTVTAAVLSREESQAVFDVDLAAKGVQPVWLEIENNTDVPFAFLPIALDRDYFSPNEVSWLNHFKFNSSANKLMDRHFSEYGIEVEYIMPGEKDKGFVYSNLDPGIKYVDVTLYQIDRIERFVFIFEVPGIQPDYKNVNFEELYSENEIVNIEDEDDLRAVLEAIPCCTVDKRGEGEGHPVNIILIGDPDYIFTAIIGRSWDVTEADIDSFDIDLRKIFSTANYRTFPMESLYNYGRRQDISLQKSRNTGGTPLRQRNQMRLWLSPFMYRGNTIWIGSVSREIGSDLRVRKYWFAAEEIDPDVDETRENVVEDLVLSQYVHKLGYVKGAGAASQENPRTNLFGQPWWSDGYRAVFIFGNDKIGLDEMDFLLWENIQFAPHLGPESGSHSDIDEEKGGRK